MSILGLDWGTRRIGVAVADALGFVHPRPPILRKHLEQDLAEIARLARAESAEKIVLGLPRRLSGEERSEAEEIRRIGSRLEHLTGRPVSFADERLTTKEAERFLIGSDRSRRKRRAAVDSAAAVLILEGYLPPRGGHGPVS